MGTDNSTWKDDIRRRFNRLSALNVLSNLTVPMSGLVDTAMLGHLSDIRFLAGVAIGSVLFDYIYWSFGFLRMGTTGTVAQAMGREDRNEVYLTLYRSVFLALIIAFPILVLQTPLRELGFAVMSAAPGVEAAGREYFDTRIWAAPATLANFALVGWFLGREQSQHALWMTVTANLANLALDYLFIIRLGWAAWGAGLATALSQYLMLVCGLTLLLRQGNMIPLRRSELLRWDRLSKLLTLNREILVRTLCLITAFAVFTNISALLGTLTLAANTILLRLLTFGAFLIDGLAFAAESLAGRLKGSGDFKRLQFLIQYTIRSSLLIATVLALSLWIGLEPLARLLTSHLEVQREAIRFQFWMTLALGVGSLAYAYDGLFLGLTMGRALRNAMLTATLIGFLPLAWLAARLESNHLLWMALAGFMIARAGLLAWMLPRGLAGKESIGKAAT